MLALHKPSPFTTKITRAKLHGAELYDAIVISRKSDVVGKIAIFNGMGGGGGI